MPEAAHGLFLFCRPGFEPDLAREVRDVAQDRGAGGRAHGPVRAGWVRFECADPSRAEFVAGTVGRYTLVFARQWFRILFRAGPGDPEAWGVTVLSGLEETARRHGSRPRVRDLMVEAPDSEPGRELWPICSRLQEILEDKLRARGWLRSGARRAPRLHVALVPGEGLWAGVSDPLRSSPWPMGIPRLRIPGAAPSRSARKLEEAFLVLMDEHERAKSLKPGRRVVDLGAAPGGWSWQFARRGLVVTAVDNAALAREAVETGLVDHVRADGFRYRPDRPVDWMVCDMVKAPERIARLVGVWASKGLARWYLFNWKLPNRDRLGELRRCRDILVRELDRAGVRHTLRLRHLYHDREEVTGYLAVHGLPGDRFVAKGRKRSRR